MLNWLIYTSSSRALTALSAVALLASGDAGMRRAPDVRPRMAVTLDIAGGDFTQLLLTPDRDTLLRLMQESLPRLLDENFGFLDWRGGGDRLDTLRVHWIQTGPVPQDAQLQLTLVGRTVGGPTVFRALPFEKWARLQSRRWQPAQVSTEWSANLDTIFKRQAPELVKQLFGRIPLNLSPLDSNIKLVPERLKAVIALRPDQIRAADIPRPEFLLRVTVRDTIPPSSVDEGELALAPCRPRPPDPGFVCDIAGFTYQEEKVPVEQLKDRLRPLVLTPRSVHLLRYQPAGTATGPGGTVGP